MVEEETFCDTKKLHEIQMPVSINKVLLEHSPAHWFTSCPGLFQRQGKMGAVTDLVVLRASIYYLSWHRGNVLTPAQNFVLCEPIMTLST